MDASEHGSNGIHAAEPCDEDSLSSLLPEINDIYEESILVPRVGESYQVDIPHFQLRPVSYDDDARMQVSDRFGFGLAIPVSWIQSGINIKCEKDGLSNKGSACKMEFDSSDQDKHDSYSGNYEIPENCQKDYCLSLSPKREASGFFPFPGSPTLFLSDMEKQSFLLGLYIFGKNLSQVKKFMENNGMGDLLSFYYGKFYRSDAYRRWSECRKIRSRRSIHGQRIFTGWRQQELLSRLSNTTSDELHDTLHETSKAFNEGRATLEEFVFRLKAAVGLQVLVEAIGIGKGTYDLTVVALDHGRTNQHVPLNPEIPVGRACSSLTCADIIKFLTGDFRLSKARSNDLFWEAVWPRLLARGWHSEQPKDHGSLSFKNALVFLIPGVKKFSKKRLVKGTHFFDSVTDVLSKVASDPRLLEFDVEAAKACCGIKEENGRADVKVYQNGSSNHQRRHCYMHPRLSNCNSECMKFTVVDTSLAQREGSFRVMEVKSLPLHSPSSYLPSAVSEESGGGNSSELQDSSSSSSSADQQRGSNRASLSEKKPEAARSAHSDLSKTLKAFAASTNGCAPGYKGLVKRRDGKAGEARYQNSRRVKSGQANYSAPSLKRKKLTASSRGYDDPLATLRSIQEEKKRMRLKPVPLKPADDMNRDAGPFQEKTNLPYHKLEPEPLIDLNNLPPDADFTESTSSEFKPEELVQSSLGKQPAGSQVSIQYYSDVPVDEQPSTRLRRQSTRNRPPTAKALEALANGFLGTKRSWRPSAPSNRPSRKARKAYEMPVSATVIDPSNVDSRTLSASDAEAVDTDYEKLARKGTHELLGVP